MNGNDTREQENSDDSDDYIKNYLLGIDDPINQDETEIFNYEYINQEHNGNEVHEPSANQSILFQPKIRKDSKKNQFGVESASRKSGGDKMILSQIVNPKDMEEYLQEEFTGNKKKRFNRKKLHSFYEKCGLVYGWKKLARKEKRSKKLVFEALFRNKEQVISFIRNFPWVIAQILLVEGK